jgi:UDP-N-acetylglucosamine:LPS N-acetylglucosamine transferase
MNATLNGKKILILYTAHTMGHQRVAENIGWWLGQSGAVVSLREVLKSNPSPLVQKYLKAHIWVNRHIPWFWKFLYRWGFWFSMPFRLPVAGLNSKETEAILAEVKPDVVITTQTSPSAVMSVLKRKRVYTGVWGIAFSDYHFHRYWAYPRADFYLTNIEEQATELARLGVNKERIFRAGLALPPAQLIDAAAVRARLGLEEKDRIILLGTDTLGMGLPAGILEVLDDTLSTHAPSTNAVVLVLCGKNEALYQDLEKLRATYAWLYPLRFYEPLAELYAISDLMLAKPGGLTIAETLQLGLPVFVTHYLPGQEELNIAYLAGLQAIVPLYVKPKSEWPAVIAEEWNQGVHRQRLRGQAHLTTLVAPENLENLGQFISDLFHAQVS